MKNISVFLFIVMFGFLSVSKAQDKPKATVSPSKIEVIYFHATNRCPTCMAVESNARKAITDNFKNELTNGKIKFTSINIDDKINKALVEKYEIAFSSLLIIKKTGLKESKTDFTDIGFQYARTDPTKYADLLKAEIRKNLL